MPKTGRSLVGMVAGFIPEWWPVFDRNGGRLHVGIRTSRVDAAVADAFLAALAPAEIDVLSRARRAQQQVEKALRSSAERELERKRYAAALVERQFNRVDPDNRLVAGELERRWEAALSEVRAAEGALARQASAEPVCRSGKSAS
ncbi:hypothetical protein [Mesorhizobium sp. M0323]|uniref:hypothetical protein n=1 Tax=Mesorhizobium sp. M0323 TaxID=2956938 RepID=UPI00333AEF53